MKRLLIAALLLPTLTSAQAPDQERRARELLASPNLVDKAWGAFWAGRLHTASMSDLLIQQLTFAEAYLDVPSDSAGHAYVLTLFDGLIESGATVPAQTLTPFVERWHDEVLILLARQEGNEDLLLAMREQKLKRVYWLTVNNLLLRIRPPRFFRQTLVELEIRHTFTVVDQDLTGYGGGAGGGIFACGVRRLPKGFPPIALYQLVEAPGEGYVLVVKGPHDIYYRRIVVPTDQQAGWGVPDSEPDRQADLLDYLGALTPQIFPRANYVFHRTSTIQWHDSEDYTRQVDAALDPQAAEIQQFAAAAKESGLGDTAGLRLTIVPELEDNRVNKSPLPGIVPRDIVSQ